MLTGQQTLGNLNRSLQQLQQDIHQSTTELQRLSGSLEHNQQAQTQLLNQLADIRLEALTKNPLNLEISTIDHQVAELLTQRELAYKTLTDTIEQQQQAQQSLDSKRTEIIDRLNKAVAELDQREATLQTELEAHVAYQAQLSKTRMAHTQQDAAQKKADMAVQDRTEKGKAFEANALFMYCWKRNMGTQAYKSNRLTRVLDEWVAKLCEYHHYRVTYWTLLEIPKRLIAHAEKLDDLADTEQSALLHLETQAAKTAELPLYESKVAEVEYELAALDADITTAEKALNEQFKQQANFAAGKDTFSIQCLELYNAMFSGKNVAQLRQLAQQTLDPKDDKLVRALSEERQEYESFNAERSQQQRIHQSKLDRLNDLQGVMHQFKQRQYDHPRSGFKNEALIEGVLNEFLRGVINGSSVWGTLQRQQRHRDVGAWPDFGSGGFSKPRTRRHRGSHRHSPWHQPGDGGFNLPRSGGSSSRGGFTTGGGF